MCFATLVNKIANNKSVLYYSNSGGGVSILGYSEM